MRICLIGAGNLATQLGIGLSEKGHQIIQVWSKTTHSASVLATKLNCSYTTEISSINSDSDIYILSTTDAGIETVLSGGNWSDKFVVHTAGSVPMDILAPYCTDFGVFYPFQTFTKEKKIDFRQIPICLEANTAKNLKILTGLAQTISQNVREINTDQRQQIHLAAVFACNFVNHFYSIGEELLREKGIDFDILKPLILETAGKVLTHSPTASQTGPAIREDRNIMAKQLGLLDTHPDLKILYSLISERIIKNNKKI